MSPPFPTFLRWQLSSSCTRLPCPCVCGHVSLPHSLRAHLSLYILISSCDTFHVYKNTIVFYLMNGDVILEPFCFYLGYIDRTGGCIWPAAFLTVNVCFHLWESPWGWGPWSLWGLIFISRLYRSSAGSWCRWSCPGVLWSWNHWRVPELGGNSQMKKGSERWSS